MTAEMVGYAFLFVMYSFLGVLISRAIWQGLLENERLSWTYSTKFAVSIAAGVLWPVAFIGAFFYVLWWFAFSDWNKA